MLGRVLLLLLVFFLEIPLLTSQDGILATDDYDMAKTFLEREQRLIVYVLGWEEDIRHWLNECEKNDSLANILASDYVIYVQEEVTPPSFSLIGYNDFVLKVFPDFYSPEDLYHDLKRIAENKDQVFSMQNAIIAYEKKDSLALYHATTFLSIAKEVLRQPFGDSVLGLMRIIPEEEQFLPKYTDLILFHSQKIPTLTAYFKKHTEAGILTDSLLLRLDKKVGILADEIYNDYVYTSYPEILEQLFKDLGIYIQSFGTDMQRKRYRYFQKSYELSSIWDDNKNDIYNNYVNFVDLLILPQIRYDEYLVSPEIVLTDLCQIVMNLTKKRLNKEQYRKMAGWLEFILRYENDFFLHDTFIEVLKKLDDRPRARYHYGISKELKKNLDKDIRENIEDFLDKKVSPEAILDTAIRYELDTFELDSDE